MARASFGRYLDISQARELPEAVGKGWQKRTTVTRIELWSSYYVYALVLALLSAGIEVHCLRDLTRGGLATAMVEIAETGGVRIELIETAIPICPEVHAACEILGLDPLHVANEGRLIAFVPAAQVDRALGIMRSHRVAADSVVIGSATESDSGLVTMTTSLDTRRLITMLSGEQLPRIC